MTSLDTRNVNYHSHRASGKLTSQQLEIMARIERSCERYGPHDFSLQEIAANTRLPINVVSGRVNELKRLGQLVECKKRPCRVTGRTITPVIPAKYKPMEAAS